MDYSIKKLTGFTDQDLKNLNDNLQYIKMKIFENVKETSVTTETTTATEVKPFTIGEEIIFPNGCFINTYNGVVRIGCGRGDYIAIGKGYVNFYMGDNGALGIPDWALRPDGLHNKDDVMVLDTNGIIIHPTFY